VVNRALDSSFATPGRALDEHTRVDLEDALDADLASVRIHTDAAAAGRAQRMRMRAFTVGGDIGFAAGEYRPDTPAGQRLLTHEVTHVLQQAQGGSISPEVSWSQDVHLEAEADRVADTGGHERVRGRSARRIQGQSAMAHALSQGALSGAFSTELAGAMTPAKARAAMGIYRKLDPLMRRLAFESNYPGGRIAALLRALPPEDAAGPYVAEVRELLRWIQEVETQAASGMTNVQMGAAEAKFITARATAAAAAAKKAKGSVAPPTAADVEAERSAQVVATSMAPAPTNRWLALKPAEQKKWTAEGNAAVSAIVAYAKKTHPELKLSAASFKLSFQELDDRAQGALAMGGTDAAGNHIAQVGFEFVTAVKADPAYALSTVVHEISGHPEFDVPGKVGYAMTVYDLATKSIPGYSGDRQTDLDAYDYQETEIYSLLRELPYWTPVAKKHAGMGIENPDPKRLVTWHVGLIKQQWEPKLAVAMLHGLYRRLKADPRIPPMSIAAFEASIRTHFKGAAVGEIIK
jgi:hypothetical protein